eukprot:4072659-Pleurochrysis_carterae.AAC.7
MRGSLGLKARQFCPEKMLIPASRFASSRDKWSVLPGSENAAFFETCLAAWTIGCIPDARPILPLAVPLCVIILESESRQSPCAQPQATSRTRGSQGRRRGRS